jgi:hypothetical protein
MGTVPELYGFFEILHTRGRQEIVRMENHHRVIRIAGFAIAIEEQRHAAFHDFERLQA